MIIIFNYISLYLSLIFKISLRGSKNISINFGPKCFPFSFLTNNDII